jgi:hypothetical protein
MRRATARELPSASDRVGLAPAHTALHVAACITAKAVTIFEREDLALISSGGSSKPSHHARLLPTTKNNRHQAAKNIGQRAVTIASAAARL